LGKKKKPTVGPCWGKSAEKKRRKGQKGREINLRVPNHWGKSIHLRELVEERRQGER